MTRRDGHTAERKLRKQRRQPSQGGIALFSHSEHPARHARHTQHTQNQSQSPCASPFPQSARKRRCEPSPPPSARSLGMDCVTLQQPRRIMCRLRHSKPETCPPFHDSRPSQRHERAHTNGAAAEAAAGHDVCKRAAWRKAATFQPPARPRPPLPPPAPPPRTHPRSELATDNGGARHRACEGAPRRSHTSPLPPT